MNITDYIANSYGNIGSKSKQILNELEYCNLALNMLCELYNYDFNDYDGLNGSALEIILATNGCAVIGIDSNADLHIGLPSGDAKFDDMGFPEYSEGVTISGLSLSDCVTIRNNSTMRNEVNIIKKLSYMLSRGDFAEDRLIKKCVCNPMPVAKTEQAYNAIADALKKNGELAEDVTIVKILESAEWDSDNTDKKDFDMIDLTNVSYADKFKYLSQFHEDILARYYTLFGFALHSPTKLSQTNNPEIQGRDKSSMLYVTNRLEQRKIGIGKVNKKFGTNFNIEFSDFLKATEKSIVNGGDINEI